jgi:dihydrofolate synthase/folylpolyglutamate synthase
MKLDELAAWLAARTTTGIHWGLERTEELLAGVDDPHRRFRSVHIAGTNGKGSVAAFCEAALRADRAGRRVGLYTSPHLISFAERIRIDGRPASDETILAAAQRLLPAIERTGATFFEAATAIAFLCFAEAGVDLAVVEVGLGGRLDATNVIDPIATAVTNIALEHTALLGNTIEEIAREKAGIFKRGVPAITGERNPAAVDVLRRRALEVGAPFATLDERVTEVEARVETSGTRVRFHSAAWGERELQIPLPGEHQARNALLAAELLAVLPEPYRPSWDAVASGFAGVRWPGRVQVETIRGTTWVFDVAHNPAGVDVLVACLDRMELPRPIVLVGGILADKEWKRMLGPLLERVDSAILTTPPTAPPSRRWRPGEAAEWATGVLGSTPRVIEDFASALTRAETLAPHGTILVTGSVHTVGDALAVLEIPLA